VKVAATERGLPVLQPESLKDDAVQSGLAQLRADLIVVAAYGKILPRAVLAIPARGAVNVHASLLPRWRGASPITAAILAGDAETGVTIMEMAPKMDAGAIISQERTTILPDDTTGSLETRLATTGARLLVETLPGWLSGDVPARPQDESSVTYCSLVRKEDGELSVTMTAEEAERAVRAYDPWPGASVGYRGKRLAIWRAHAERGEGGVPGTLVHAGRSPAISFTGGLLVLDELQRTGSKRMTGAQFLNGEHGRLEPAVHLQ
jgi:methionyl-tRNA formyltransferase